VHQFSFFNLKIKRLAIPNGRGMYPTTFSQHVPSTRE